MAILSQFHTFPSSYSSECITILITKPHKNQMRVPYKIGHYLPEKEFVKSTVTFRI